MKKPEILAGVGSMPALQAAIQAKTDAVYFGIKDFNMRAFITNFEESQLKKVVDLCHENNIKAYLTINIIIYEEELKKLEKIIKLAKEANIDAIIASDLAVIQKCEKHKIPVHISTQESISNSQSAEFFKKIGAKRIVLARELTLEQIKKIKQKTDIELEIFVHGSQCISVSGRCFLSHELFNSSANRGLCVQPCRRAWLAEDPEKQIVIGPDYLLSPNDLCSIDIIDKLIEANIDSFKIEGRSKPAEYVRTTVECYKKARDAVLDNTYSKEIVNELMEELKTVYNRGFSHSHLLGRIKGDFVEAGKSQQTKRRVEVGIVKNYYQNKGVAEIKLTKDIEKGQEILIEGKHTFFTQTLDSMQKDKKIIETAKSGDSVGLLVNDRVRKNDIVFVIVDNSDN